MKFNHALLALAISVSGIAFASEKDHDTKPLHGGVVAQSKDPTMIETVAAHAHPGDDFHQSRPVRAARNHLVHLWSTQ